MQLGVIGTGKIVQEALPVIVQTPGITVRSIWAREHSRERAAELAATYGIPQVYTDYDALLADEAVDFVYVALVNSVHYEYTLRALQAGKNVILEKPACLQASELIHLATEARRRGLYLFEAVTLLYLPAMHRIMDELIPLIGSIRHVECNYSQRSSRMDRYLRGDVAPALDPTTGGGALMDINVYNLHFATALLGAPDEARYDCLRGFNGVDLSGTAVMTYREALAVCTGTKDTDAPSFGLVQGEKGWIRVDGPVSTLQSVTLCLRGKEPSSLPVAPVSHRMAPEFAAFERIYTQHDQATMNRWLDHSIVVMSLLDVLRRRQ